MASAAELPDYVNQQPAPGQQQQCSSNTETGTTRPLLLSFGVLCILQAVLNVTLRLSLSAPTVSNITQNQNERDGVGSDCNNLQERFNALTHEKNVLEDRISKLNNIIWNMNLEKSKLLEQKGVSAVCPIYWTKKDSRCYYLSSDSDTWEASRQNCQTLKGDLVAINNEEEMRFIRELTYMAEPFWIDLRLAGDQRDHGSAWHQISWDSKVEMSPSRCGMIQTQQMEKDWILTNCEEKRPWMCERDPLPQS